MAPERRLTKNEKKRLKAKEKKTDEIDNNHIKNLSDESETTAQNDNEIFGDIEIEYVSANPTDTGFEDASLMDQFKAIFEKFAKPEELIAQHIKADVSSLTKSIEGGDDTLIKNESMTENKEDAEGEAAMKLSKKKKKLMSRLSVAELKQLVQRPDVVEAHDITSSDPKLLVFLKAYRNTVAVPRHWCAKRKYLQGKRGMEKAPFQLPDFIADTGIAKIRESVLEQEALKKSKQKNRDRMQPKTGKIDIDYQVLHDAFFKYQTKPKLTRHGDLYYEGKEFEVHIKEKTPGVLSAELKEALGLSVTATGSGTNAGDNANGSTVASAISSTVPVPPPWLINMQRYGPPPSYPSMRIPGLNAPIPPGASFGYQAGGWGKPPVDEYGRPLYGDVFGVLPDTEGGIGGVGGEEIVDKNAKWGELLITETEYESEEEEEEDEENEEDLITGSSRSKLTGSKVTSSSGMETPATLDGISSVATTTTTGGMSISGLETSAAGLIDLRKRAGGLETPDSMYGGGPNTAAMAHRELYQVIQERNVVGGLVGQLFGSDRTYVIPGMNANDVEEQLHKEQQQQQEQQGGEGGGVEGEEGKEGGKRKRRLDSSNIVKKYKDFKF